MKQDTTVQKGEVCPTCGRYYSRHLTANSLVIKDGKILLVKRNIEPYIGFWALPGGYVDWDETVEIAATREVREETGIGTEVIKLFGVYSNPNRTVGGLQNIAVIFIVRQTDAATVQFDPNETQRVEWVSLDSLPEQLASDHRSIIEDYIKTQ